MYYEFLNSKQISQNIKKYFFILKYQQTMGLLKKSFSQSLLMDCALEIQYYHIDIVIKGEIINGISTIRFR